MVISWSSVGQTCAAWTGAALSRLAIKVHQRQSGEITPAPHGPQPHSLAPPPRPAPPPPPPPPLHEGPRPDEGSNHRSSELIRPPLHEGPRPQSPPPPPPPPAPSLHPTHQDNAFAPPRLSRIHSEARRPSLMREAIRGNQWHSGRSTFKLIGSSRSWLTCMQ